MSSAPSTNLSSIMLLLVALLAGSLSPLSAAPHSALASVARLQGTGGAIPGTPFALDGLVASTWADQARAGTPMKIYLRLRRARGLGIRAPQAKAVGLAIWAPGARKPDFLTVQKELILKEARFKRWIDFAPSRPGLWRMAPAIRLGKEWISGEAAGEIRFRCARAGQTWPMAPHDAWVILYSRGRGWPRGRSILDLDLSEHRSWLKGLHRRGLLVAAGPFVDDAGELLVLRAQSRKEALALVQEDPAVKRRVFRAKAHPWFAIDWSR